MIWRSSQSRNSRYRRSGRSHRPFRYWLAGRTMEQVMLRELGPLVGLEEERLR
jgi:hypothetical protein